MPQLKLEDVWVQFPFVPYKQQEKFMGHIINCLNHGHNALLESPTGTGKTLCLLCSSLAWLDARRRDEEVEQVNSKVSNPLRCERKHKIIFCSRTHSQLQQSINEFQSTNYQHLRAAFLGSRKHLCINEKVRHDKNLDSKCRALRKPTNCKAVPPVDIEDVPVKCTSCRRQHPCRYYEEFEEVKKREIQVFTEIGAMDHKQLWSKCKQLNVCPFYVSRHLAQKADIIFMPYSYIFNSHILRSLKIELKDSIIIVDEGHNIERICEENASIDIKDELLEECVKELAHVKKASDRLTFPTDLQEADVSELEGVVNFIRNGINNLKEGTYLEGDIMVNIFEAAGLTSGNIERLFRNVKHLINFCGEEDFKADGLRNFVSVAQVILYQDHSISESDRLEEMKQSFTVYVDRQIDENPTPRITHFWCFNASIVMRSFMRRNVLSIIVTSGTLSPLEPLSKSLGIPFPVQKVNDHVIDCKQALGIIVRSGPNNVKLNSSKDKRESVGIAYYIELGRVIIDIAHATPNGLLIFFTSKAIRKECLNVWSNNNFDEHQSIYEALHSVKEILEEPEAATNLPDLQKKFYEAIDKDGSNGACLIGIMSGKVSEGLDFKNHYGRAVVVVGLPYPPCHDAWVVRKQQVLCLRFSDCDAGKEWYRVEATRSVNQAVGRVIRHRTDYGAIVLLDERFACCDAESLGNYDVFQDLPKWLRRNLQTYGKSQRVLPDLKSFFEDITEEIFSIRERVAHEQNLACERYHKDLIGEEVPAAEFSKLQENIDKEKRQQVALEEKVSQLTKNYHELQNEVDALANQIKCIEIFEENEVPYDSDWESDGQSQWDALSLD